MRKLGVLVACIAALAAVAPGNAMATHECGIPHSKLLWIDFGDGSVPFWRTFAKPGNVVAAANFIYPPRIRALGAKTVYFDLHFKERVGSTTNPSTQATVEERANKLYDYAAAAMGCADPWIALNELFGAALAPPWSAAYAQYRANVLTFMRVLQARGARPFLLVNTTPYTAGEARDWWRQVIRYGDIVREVYFPAPLIYKRGPIVANRSLRQAFRRGITDFTDIGIPVRKLGIYIGFQTEPGSGGREGLKPAQAWFRTIKWQVLSAREVARELGFAGIWSWGWAVWGNRGADPDKPAAACVYLWTRNPKWCNGPRVAGAGFNTSLTEGQIDLARGIRCLAAGKAVRNRDVSQARAVTGDADLAYSAVFARAIGRRWAPVRAADVTAAESRVVAARFGGSRAGYRSALARGHASRATALGVIEDELRRTALEQRFRVGAPSSTEVRDYYETYAAAQTRPVQVTPAPRWLGGRKQGLALSSTAPERVFTIPAGRSVTVVAPQAKYRVRALGPVRPLQSVPLATAQPSIRAALAATERNEEFTRWSVTKQVQGLRLAMCRRDELPTADAVDLADYLPFLSLT